MRLVVRGPVATCLYIFTYAPGFVLVGSILKVDVSSLKGIEGLFIGIRG
jgi:hypothetical protein